MKIMKSLILTLMLSSATFAGDMPQFDPAPPRPTSQQVTNDIGGKILVAVIQNLLSLR